MKHRYFPRTLTRRQQWLVKRWERYGWFPAQCDCHRLYVHRHLRHNTYDGWMIIS